MKVTKEDVDKARATHATALDVDVAAYAADVATFAAAWNKYIKLKEAFENGN